MVEKKGHKPLAERKNIRTNQHMFVLNDQENQALNKFLKKYNIKNKSKFIRETLMRTIIVKMEADSPTLFDNVE